MIPRLAQGRVRGNLSSFPRTRGEARKRLKRAKAKQRRSPSPKRGAGAAALAGGTACPPVLENVGGRCGRDSGLRHHKPPSLPPYQGQVRKHPARQRKLATATERGAGGASPRRGYRGCPPVPKTLEGGSGGTTAQAKADHPMKEAHAKPKPSTEGRRRPKQNPPPKEGARQTKTLHRRKAHAKPKPSAEGRRTPNQNPPPKEGAGNPRFPLM